MRATSTLAGFCLVLALSPAISFAATGEMLAELAQRQEWAKLAALVTKQVDVNAPQPDGTTALHWAAHWNDLKTAELLIAAGAHLNALTRTGVSALSLACENGNPDIAVRLLDAGADANIADVGGMTPLMVASRAGNLDAVKALIARGAKVDAATIELGQTALMWAAVEGHASIVKLLVDHGAGILTVSKQGFTPLLFAVRGGRLEVVKTLVEAGADVNVETPVLPASPAILTYQLGADPIRPLPLAIANNHAPVALYLLEKGANPNQSTGGMSALHHAVYGIGQNRASGLGGDDGSLLIGRFRSCARHRRMSSRRRSRRFAGADSRTGMRRRRR